MISYSSVRQIVVHKVPSSMHILIAEELTTIPTLLDALESYETAVATTIKDAKALLSDHAFNLAIVGFHFDESRAIELISWMTSNAVNVPIILVQMSPSDLERPFDKTGASLVKGGAICRFLNLEHAPEWQEILKAAIGDCGKHG